MPSKNIGKTYKIEEISIKKNKVIVKISSKKLIFTLDSFDDLKLNLGDEISPSYLEELKNKSKFDELYFFALDLLKKDGYSSFKLKQKLWKKGATIDQSQKIIFKLSSLHLLDDLRYANNYVLDIGPYKGIGKNKIIYLLIKAGISTEIIEKLDFNEEDELKKAIAQVEKLNRQLSKKPDKKKKEKIVSSLISNGFEYKIARSAIKYITPNDKSIMRKQLKIDFDSAYRKLSKVSYGKELIRKLCRQLMNKGYEFEEILDLLKEEGIYEDD